LIERSSLRVALRTLGRHRGFTVVAVLSIAIAIALNTTMYSALDKLIDPRINAREPDHIYSIRYFGDHKQQLHPTAIEEALVAGMKGVEALSGIDRLRFVNPGFSAPLAEAGSEYTRVHPIVVRANFFEFLGTPATAGRTFLDRDEGSTNVVISDRLATKLFRDESPIGRSLKLHGMDLVVIGVVHRTQAFPLLSPDLWLLRPPNAPAVPVTLVRFREKIDRFAINDQLDIVARRLAIAAGEPVGKTAFRGQEFVLQERQLSGFHWALIAAVAAVLLVACANLANLQLARGLARTRELALRSAVGASRRQLIAHLLLETGIIAVVGLVLGVVLTLWGIHIVRATIPPEMDAYMIEPQTSWRMFVFAAVAALVCLFLVGLLPAVRISRVDPNDLLKSGSGTGANREHRRRYGIMVIAQIGFALPVLIGAIVLLKSSWRYASKDYLVREMYGYDPSPLVTANIPFSTPPGSRLRLADVANQVTALAKSVPGAVDAAVITYQAPEKRRVTVDDANGILRDEAAYGWAYRVVSPSYFRVYGHRIERGRDFADSEFDGNAVIMDARTAKFLWGNENPIGRVIKFGNAPSKRPWHRIVGIVGDQRDTNAIRRWDPNANFRLNAVYRVITPTDSFGLQYGRSPQGSILVPSVRVAMYLRVRGNTELAAVRLQRALRGVSAGVEPTVAPMVEELGIVFWRKRSEFAASLFSTFALIGLGLVAIGVYGIVAHSVEERRRELGVRIALGATTRDILHSVLREGNVLILSGVAVGLLLIKYTVGLLGGFIPESYSYDAVLFAAIAAALFAIAAFSAFVPAWRATRIDPVEALRSE